MNILFYKYFLTSNILLTFLIAVILITKHIFSKHISVKFQYYIWYMYLILLLLPFLSIKPYFFNLNNLFQNFSSGESFAANLLKNSSSSTLSTNSGWLQDFSLSVNRSASDLINYIIVALWLIGMIILAILTFINNLKIKQLQRWNQLIENEEILTTFLECKKLLNIQKDITLYVSSFVKTPISYSLFKPRVILPVNVICSLTRNDIRNIFLHELQHFKQKDLIINYLMCILQTVYWFNPIVWYAFKEMRMDREITCDRAVLERLNQEDFLEYGNTIINFADKILRSPTISCVSDMGGSMKQIKKRIIKIASFQTDSKWLKMKSIFIMFLLGTIVLCSSPLLSVRGAMKSNYSFSANNTTYEDLSYYFQGYKGCFVLYDTQADQYTMYNKERCSERYSPDSTYKIYSALFGLEKGIITRGNSSLEWNGKVYPYDSWNENQNLSSAMKNSVNWYFQGLDKKIGMENLKKYFNRIKYGNTDLSGGISEYWLQSSLLISPLEQVELLKRFYSNEFGFKEKNIQAVKDAILLSDSNNSSLSGKTGTGNVNGKNIMGWFIGYVETDNNTYFFATNIQNDDNTKSSTAVKITLSILEDRKIYDSNY